MLNTEIVPYTNFIGPGGITFCAEGTSYEGTVKASAVYFPDPHGSRFSIEDNSLHEKRIFDGTPGEEGSFTHLAREIISLFYHTGNETGQRFIQIPVPEIDRVYDHRESMQALLKGKCNAPELLQDKLVAVMRFLESYGVSPRDVGLYGGLQRFLVSTKNRNFKDIDIVLHGLDNVEIMKSLASQTQKNIQTIYSAPRVRSTPENMRRRRHELTRIFLPNDSTGTYCDVKLLRNSGDELSYPFDAKIEGRMVLTGVVEVDREAFSTPTTYQVRTDEGSLVKVSSVKYDFIAAAAKNDRVVVSGAKCKDLDHVVLIDTEHDFIRV